MIHTHISAYFISVEPLEQKRSTYSHAELHVELACLWNRILLSDHLLYFACKLRMAKPSSLSFVELNLLQYQAGMDIGERSLARSLD